MGRCISLFIAHYSCHSCFIIIIIIIIIIKTFINERAY